MTWRMTSSGGASASLRQLRHQRGEVAQAGRRLALDRRDLVHLGGGRQQAQLARLGVAAQMLQRHLADAAGRLVDRPQERQVVARIEQQPQIGQHVLVFLAVEEARPLDDLERHALLDERRFQAARQGVDAQEDGEVAVVALARRRRPRGCARRCPRLRPRPVSKVSTAPAGRRVVGDRSFGLRCLLWAIRWRRRAGSPWCCGSSAPAS